MALSLLDPYSSNYARLYVKWQYYDDLIAHLEKEHEISLPRQQLKLSKDMSAILKKKQQTSDSIVFKALAKSTTLELELNLKPMEVVKYL